MQRTGTVFKYQPHQVLCHNDFVEPSDMRVYKLSVMVDFAGKVRIVFSRGFKNHLYGQSFPSKAQTSRTPTFEPFVRLCLARYTFPKEPFPINLPSV